MIKNMIEAERDAVFSVADLMVAAARTAPKGSGRDNVLAVILTGKDKDQLVEAMQALAKEFNEDFIDRDALNVDNSHCVVVIGVKNIPFGLENCHMCGFENCATAKKLGANCTFNITDLGVAIGSAVSIAADHRIDNRVMYSAGKGAIKIKCLPEDVKVCYGIPLYTGSKSIYFDRNPGAVLI